MNTKPILSAYENQKDLAEQAIYQLQNDDLLTKIHNSNSICSILSHVGCHLRSRWTNILNSDLEKGRNKIMEFETQSVEIGMNNWNEGWNSFKNGLSQVSEIDENFYLVLRGEKISVIDHIMRNYGHTCLHIGQIILIAKIIKKSNWVSLQ